MENDTLPTDADIADKIEKHAEIESLKKEAKARAAAKALEEKKKPKKKRRLELEQRFIGRVLSEANEEGDIRECVAKLGVSWRWFIDKRHRAIWRALEVLDLHSIVERADIITEEAYSNPGPANSMLDAPGDDLVRGESGSAADKQFTAKLKKESSTAVIWFERALEASNAFRLVGGKVYLREIVEIGDFEFDSPEFLAEKLFGVVK